MTEGGLTKPLQHSQTLKWTGEVSQFSATGPVPINLLSAANLELSKERIFLSPAKLTMAGGVLSIDNTLWTPQQWHSQGIFNNISIRPGSHTSENRQSLQLGGEWNITSATQLTGHLHIIREKGDWIFPGDVPLSLGLETLQFTGMAENGNLSANLNIQGKNIGVTKASISLPLAQQDASWPISPNAPLNGQINANINDISWIGQNVG